MSVRYRGVGGRHKSYLQGETVIACKVNGDDNDIKERVSRDEWLFRSEQATMSKATNATRYLVLQTRRDRRTSRKYVPVLYDALAVLCRRRRAGNEQRGEARSERRLAWREVSMLLTGPGLVG